MRRRRPAPSPTAVLALAVLLAGGLVAVLVAGCRAEAPPVEGPAAEEAAIVVLSELDEEVVGGLLAAWSAATGFEVEVRYGAPGELAAAALAGEPADEPTVLLSGDAVGLARLAAAGRALPLPADLAAAVPALFVDPERRWVGLTGRARMVVYDPLRLGPEELPADLRGFGDPARRGRFGLAPESRSFRIHLAAYRALHGPEALARLLERLAENEPVLHADGEALVRAVRDREIDFALVDHPDLWRVRAAERGEAAGEHLAEGLAVLPLPAADASGYLGLAGAAVLGESAGALALVRHLLGDAAQAHLAAATFEYPLLPAVELPAGLLPLADLDLAQVDYRAVAAALAETEAAIEASALTP
jgi:iron(III) transport system substrate-binding protein